MAVINAVWCFVSDIGLMFILECLEWNIAGRIHSMQTMVIDSCRKQDVMKRKLNIAGKVQ